MALVGGYTVFLPGRWSVPDFFFSYAMFGALPLLFLFWKITQKSKVKFLRSESKAYYNL
jgi:yeast amino acid transporter